jgi:hypothetical protein
MGDPALKTCRGRFFVAAFATGLGLLETPPSAFAQTVDPDDPRARQFFEVGRQAYEKSEYLLAIEAFEHAYAIVPRPGLLFSLGQAHQHQFRAKAEPQHLSAALDYYRRYLSADEKGRRRGEALAAIEALDAIDKQLHPPGEQGVPAIGSIFGQLMVSSPTPGVTVTVEGDRVETLPASLRLAANTYLVEASAPGYAPERRSVRIVSGTTVPLDLDLQPLPAHLSVAGPTGAEAFVDWRPIGFLPIPVQSLSAGEHWVSLRLAGRTTSSTRVTLGRGETGKAELALETTTQRRAAWVSLGVGAAALVATGVFAGIAVERDSVARSLNAQRQSGGITPAQADQLNSAVGARDDFKTLAVVGGVSAAALLGAGLLLYLTESPAPPHSPGAESARATRPWQIEALSAPSLWGASLRVAF